MTASSTFPLLPLPLFSVFLQLKENIAAFELDLDEETLAAVDAIHLQCRNPNASD